MESKYDTSGVPYDGDSNNPKSPDATESKLTDKLDSETNETNSLLKRIAKELARKTVRAMKHPELNLKIYNYTQGNKIWNEITRMCRGLVLDDQGTVVARPFEKFFDLPQDPQDTQNVPEHKSIDVYEKLDGSMGVLFFYNRWMVCTRGSFVSKQAQWAQDRLKLFDLSSLQQDKTYVLEIIYPEDRHVVDYKGRKDLVLLAVFDTATGAEVPFESLGSRGTPFSMVKKSNIATIQELHACIAKDKANAEGFVIVLRPSGERFKAKFPTYKTIDRAQRTVISNRTVVDELQRIGIDCIGTIKSRPPGFLTDVWPHLPKEKQEAVVEIIGRAVSLFVSTRNNIINITDILGQQLGRVPTPKDLGLMSKRTGIPFRALTRSEPAIWRLTLSYLDKVV
jgi:hypothetical protein